LLSNDNMPLEAFSVGERLKTLNSGCCVLVINRDAEHNTGFPLTLPICCWKGKTSMRAYIAKNERNHFLRLCGADVTETDAVRSTERERHKLKNQANSEVSPVDENQLIDIEKTDDQTADEQG